MIENLSLCLICKDDEENIGKLIKKAKQYISEIIVLDTGSSDNSVITASNAGATVYDYSCLKNPITGYISSFSEARNLSFSFATKDWIMWLDSDDDLSDWQQLEKVVKEAELYRIMFGPGVQVRLNYDYTWVNDRTLCIQSFFRERIIHKEDGWIWKRPIHEHLYRKSSVDLTVDYLSVIHLSDGGRGIKNDRNINILLNWKNQESLSQSDIDVINYYLGDEFLVRQQFQEAFKYFNSVSSENFEWKLKSVYRACLALTHHGFAIGDSEHPFVFLENCCKTYWDYLNFKWLFALVLAGTGYRNESSKMLEFAKRQEQESPTKLVPMENPYLWKEVESVLQMQG